ncbi:MFS transporter [Lacticaseibacillus mingshuiensis]|uniref:MFS transporter n=1 Tax=Lacticaseibacillus mingshuiensis TaxID=2799574 RepID=A0ABW4CL87_9LACO|nr:MFS transporter [Lacticaseibacillus mingshuiensis]
MTERLTRRTQLAILATALLSFLGILIETSMNVTFPTLMADLHVSLTTVQWVTTGYLLLVTIVMGASAYLLKRFDGRQIFRAAFLFSLAGAVMCATAPDFALLMTGRLLQALATGLSTPLLFEIIFTRVPKRQLGTYTGLAEMMISLAPALGPTYGGLFTNALSWRWIFWVIVPLIILVGVLGEATIRTKASRTAGKFDVLGLSLLSLFFAVLVWAFNAAGQTGFTSRSFWLWLAVAVVLLGAQVIHIRRGGTQLLDWHILRDRVLSLRLVTYFLLQFINIGASFLIPLFIEDVLGENALVAGLILFPGAMIGAIVAPFAGRLYDQHGLRRLILFSGALVLLGTGLFSLLTGQLTLALITLLFIVLRIGFNSGFGNTMSEASQLVPVANKADQNSLFNMMQQYSGSLSTGMLAAVIAAVGTGRSVRAATRLGSGLGFALLAGLALIALLAAVAANHLSQKETSATR